MKVDLKQVEETAKELYVRALKLLPPDIKKGFDRLDRDESDGTAKAVLGTMIRNIKVAEDTNNLLCQDTGIPIYNVTIGGRVEVDGHALKQAIVRGCERATREHPLRSSVVHPVTRVNQHTSCGRSVPVINIDFSADAETLSIEMIPKGSGSENNSWLKMAIPAEGVDAVKTFVIDCVLDAGGKTCPPTIIGVGVGGTADLCVHLSKVAATRPLGTRCEDPEGAKLEEELLRMSAADLEAFLLREYPQDQGWNHERLRDLKNKQLIDNQPLTRQESIFVSYFPVLIKARLKELKREKDKVEFAPGTADKPADPAGTPSRPAGSEPGDEISRGRSGVFRYR